MLGYRHGFHAGNFADVVKHSVLVMELGRFVLKDTPFLYFDTHGGRGIYDLNSEWAETGEAERGIKRLFSCDLTFVNSYNFSLYPIKFYIAKFF